VWQAIQYVSSGFTLCAFLVAVIASYLKKRSQDERLRIESALPEDRAELVAITLEGFHVDTGNLTRQQQFEVAMKQINARIERFRILAIVVVILACLGAGLSAYAISNANPRVESISRDKTPVPIPVPTPAPTSSTENTKTNGSVAGEVKPPSTENTKTNGSVGTEVKRPSTENTKTNGSVGTEVKRPQESAEPSASKQVQEPAAPKRRKPIEALPQNSRILTPTQEEELLETLKTTPGANVLISAADVPEVAHYTAQIRRVFEAAKWHVYAIRPGFGMSMDGAVASFPVNLSIYKYDDDHACEVAIQAFKNAKIEFATKESGMHYHGPLSLVGSWPAPSVGIQIGPQQ